MPTVLRSDLLRSLPPESSLAPRPPDGKIVVLDDDPTGTQTVHGIPVLTSWGCDELERELRAPEPAVYLLTNTRAFSAERAVAINQEIGRNLARAVRATGRDLRVISRGDSTLRGHFPAETDALAAALGDTFDGTLLVPAFFAGGRITVGDVHYVAEGDRCVPAGETEFARDATFGYRASNLREWVEEKTGGRIRAREVLSLGLVELRTQSPEAVAARLGTLPRGGVAIVNAAAPSDLAALTQALAVSSRAGRRYLFRTAADFVATYAGIAPRPLLSAAELRVPGRTSGGLLVAGSYVGKTSTQLTALFAACPALERVEIAVDRLLDPAQAGAEAARCIQAVDASLQAGRSVALYTSRRLVTGADAGESLAIGGIVARNLVSIVRSLQTPPRWLIAKGGITSSDVATVALGIRRAWVLGQALPGVPVWQTGPESKWPGLAYVVFPGNVGGPDALAHVVAPLLT